MNKKHFDISRHISWQTSSNKLINKKTLAKQLNVCPRTIDNWIKSSFLPSPILRNRRVVGWFECTLNQWLEHLKYQSIQ